MSTGNASFYHSERQLPDGDAVWSYEPQRKSIESDHFGFLMGMLLCFIMGALGFVLGCM